MRAKTGSPNRRRRSSIDAKLAATSLATAARWKNL